MEMGRGILSLFFFGFSFKGIQQARNYEAPTPNRGTASGGTVILGRRLSHFGSGRLSCSHRSFHFSSKHCWSPGAGSPDIGAPSER